MGLGKTFIGSVSIHAPVWVRLPTLRNYQVVLMFQFTHPCGCDYQKREGEVQQICFNSRTRVGATFPFGIENVQQVVSIHAPVWVRPVRNDRRVDIS